MTKTYHQLTQEGRYIITAQRMAGATQASTARLLGRHSSTIGRELKRNATTHDGGYRAEKAHSYATARLRRCRRGARFSARDMGLVTKLIRKKLSAVQVSGILTRTGRLSISHDTIYRHLRWDKKTDGDLWRHTRITSKFGRKRYGRKDSRGVQPGKRPIGDRPVEVEGRKSVGHWEGDTVIGSDRHHCILTLVERKTGYVIIKKLKARTTDEVTKAATRAIRRHCKNFKTITFDNGTEFHNDAELERRFPVKCYFATPYHSWERGSNENMNGLIRQYIPKGVCMSVVTQARCDVIADDLNNRLRKRFEFDTPAKLYHRH